jgi:hypothetical protein
MGSTAGGTIGQTRGGQIGGKSVVRSQIARTCPLMHRHSQAAVAVEGKASA